LTLMITKPGKERANPHALAAWFTTAIIK